MNLQAQAMIAERRGELSLAALLRQIDRDNLIVKARRDKSKKQELTDPDF